MAEKTWHPKFLEYMEMIKNHPNYSGLLIEKKEDGSLRWVAPKQSSTGKSRIKWALAKAKELGIKNEPGVFAKVMFKIHPTKRKACQICGKEMSLYYIYLNSSLIKSITKKFGDTYNFNTCTSLYKAIDFLKHEFKTDVIKKFLIKKFSLNQSCINKDINSIVSLCEQKCRNGESKLLGPGAMSNFPDRADGFHTYNRCCRSKEDTGRSKENLKSYTKDRRAYEYWSDGNIHAANQYMGSNYFKGSSADHVGPISLGFLHDPLFLRKMSGSDNSAKRDRLQYDDIEKIIEIENENDICGISWYSKDIWDFIKQSFKHNKNKMEAYRNALKENMNSFMTILWLIFEHGQEAGIKFCKESLLEPKLEYFKYDYKFGANGKTINQTRRNITDATRKEADRFFRIAIQSVYDYHKKNNRNVKSVFTSNEKKKIRELVDKLDSQSAAQLKRALVDVVEQHEKKILNNLLKELK